MTEEFFPDTTTKPDIRRFILFERSEFLPATSKKKKCACVLILVLVGRIFFSCVRLILVLVWGTYYVPDTYVPHFMIPGTYYVPDTYDTMDVLCTSSGWWYAWHLHSAQETAVSLFVYSLVGGGITRTFRPWTHTSDDSYIYQLSLVIATATVS